RRVISFLTLAENVLRHSPRIVRWVKLESILAQLASTYRNMVLVY
ncbi:IS4 family transposase, partial [Pectobacterium atrosepticum]|nr:IS4 family transposase [Pectobacterium atrosepticum]